MFRNYDSPLIYVSDLIFILSKLDYFCFIRSWTIAVAVRHLVNPVEAIS
jgi:hypothetical protein